MLRRNVVLSVLMAVVVLGGLGAAFAFRQKADDEKPAKKAPPKAGRLTPEKAKAEEEAIRKAEKEFTAAYNKGDLDALMALWVEDAEFISEAGKAHRGKEQVRVLLKKSLASNKGMTQKARIESLRFIRPDVAIEIGEVTLKNKDGSSTTGPFETMWVKLEGKWYISRIRDLPDAPAEDGPLAVTKLKPLAWLVGEWVDKDGKGDVTVSCKWGPNMTFLLQEFRVKQEGGKTLTVTQRIGYDAADDRVRSWVFDSAGGFADSYWERRGNTWVTDCNGTFPDGRQTTSTNQWKFINDDSFSWSSKDREVDEQPLPDINVTFIRKKGH
jgi:uncharacterized protein (TIGR02246 family)